MLKKSKKWLNFDFDRNRTFEKPLREGTDESDEMKQFFRDFKSDINALLKNTNYKIYQMKKNYYNVSLIVSNLDETKFIYISLGDVRYTKNWSERILVRTMKHPKDWTGGANHFVSESDLFNEIEILMERN